MATTRKPAAKAAKDPAKKAVRKVAKKSGAAKSASIALSGAIPKMHLSMPLDAKKIAAIKRCIDKGTLTVTLSKVDLSGGKLSGPWIYD
jgi:anti-sigma28 factor (negative regulator of flagellin synthesis)